MPKEYTDIASIVCGSIRKSNLGYLTYQLDDTSKIGGTGTFFRQWYDSAP